MRMHGREKGLVRTVRHAMLLRDLLHDFGDVGVVLVRNVWEKVVLDLVIEAADEPRKEAVVAKNVQML